MVWYFWSSVALLNFLSSEVPLNFFISWFQSSLQALATISHDLLLNCYHCEYFCCQHHHWQPSWQCLQCLFYFLMLVALLVVCINLINAWSTCGDIGTSWLFSHQLFLFLIVVLLRDELLSIILMLLGFSCFLFALNSGVFVLRLYLFVVVKKVLKFGLELAQQLKTAFQLLNLCW